MVASSWLVSATAALFVLTFSDADIMNETKSFTEKVMNYAENMEKDGLFEIEHPIENNNMSIAYQFYSPSNPRNPCILEPTEESIRACSFSSKYDTKVLIHGFTVQLKPGNLFEMMKDSLLEINPYNVIIVNWTLYNGEPYPLAISNTYFVGQKVADLLKYLQVTAGLEMETTHIIGHSLGAHVAGQAGQNAPNLGRISGLDPAGPLYEVPIPFHELSHLDAHFVDIIHSSSLTHGLGLYRPLGHIDFYPNGGITQPSCREGYQFYDADHISYIISTKWQTIRCNHAAAAYYFLASIKDCRFQASKCAYYWKFKMGGCPPETSVVAEMGLYSVKVPGIHPYTRFFLDTTDKFPYC